MSPVLMLLKSDTRTFTERLDEYLQDARAVHADNANRDDTTACVFAYSAGRLMTATRLAAMVQRLGDGAFAPYLRAYHQAAERRHQADLTGDVPAEERAYNAGAAEAAAEIVQMFDEARADCGEVA